MLNQNDRTQRFVVAWDFCKKPSNSFYRVVLDELGSSHPSGDYEMIQRSVALCRDDFVASRLAALAEHFGARVVSLPVQGEGLSAEAQNDAREFVVRILSRRLSNRGRRRG